MRKIISFFLKNEEEAVNEILKEENMVEWLYHASLYRNSKERNTTDILKYEEIMKIM